MSLLAPEAWPIWEHQVLSHTALSLFHPNFVMQQGEPGAAGGQGPAGPKVHACLIQSPSRTSNLPGAQHEVSCPWGLEGDGGEEHPGSG